MKCDCNHGLCNTEVSKAWTSYRLIGYLNFDQLNDFHNLKQQDGRIPPTYFPPFNLVRDAF